MDIHLCNPLNPLFHSINHHQISRFIIHFCDIAKWNIIRIGKNRMHTAGLDHGAVLIDYVNHNHIFLGVRFPQSPSDLLQIKNLGKRRPCHHQNAEFRIIPSLWNHIAGTQETDFLFFKRFHNRTLIFCLPCVAGRWNICLIKELCHFVRMRNIDTKNNTLSRARFARRKILWKYLDNQLISWSDPDSFLQIRIDIIPPIKPYTGKIKIRFNPVNIRFRDHSLFHRFF